MAPLADSKTEVVAEMIREFHSGPIGSLLVVGCGDGTEAAILAQTLRARVTGIDLSAEFDPVASAYCELRTGDAMALDFGPNEFDFVFSYHALEHIDDPAKALAEIRRVLRGDGGFWIGTPNRSRLVGYIGGKNTSLLQKFRWNIEDWRMRLAGRFENRFGAHAGFTKTELRTLLSAAFSSVDDRTYDYFLRIYSRRRRMIRLIQSSGLSERIYPSVYFSGRK